MHTTIQEKNKKKIITRKYVVNLPLLIVPSSHFIEGWYAECNLFILWNAAMQCVCLRTRKKENTNSSSIRTVCQQKGYFQPKHTGGLFRIFHRKFKI